MALLPETVNSRQRLQEVLPRAQVQLARDRRDLVQKKLLTSQPNNRPSMNAAVKKRQKWMMKDALIL